MPFPRNREVNNGQFLSFVEQSSATAGDERLVFALDDTPTKRYGPKIQGAGVHHNPTPGPAGQEYLYGHVWVTLGRVVKHPRWGTITLPVRAELYVREKNLPTIPEEYAWEFRTKLEQAAELIGWLKVWLTSKKKPIWLLMDGAYAKRPVLRAAATRDPSLSPGSQRDFCAGDPSASTTATTTKWAQAETATPRSVPP